MAKMKVFSASGVAAVAIYILTVVAGGATYPHYSHVSQAISELMARQAPMRDVVNILFLLYNCLLAVFAYQLFGRWRTAGTKQAALLVGLVAAASIVMTWFPMDGRYELVTTAGTVHILLAAIESVATVIATFLAGSGLHKLHPRLSRQSYWAGGLILITGLAAAVTTGLGVPVGGLFERLTIGMFLWWVLSLSLAYESH